MLHLASKSDDAIANHACPYTIFGSYGNALKFCKMRKPQGKVTKVRRIVHLLKQAVAKNKKKLHARGNKVPY